MGGQVFEPLRVANGVSRAQRVQKIGGVKFMGVQVYGHVVNATSKYSNAAPELTAPKN